MDFWRRWRTEYLQELREAHRYYPPPKGIHGRVGIGDVVLVHEENLPRGLWRLGRIENLMPGADGNIRGAAVRITSKGQGHPIIINRPIQRLYPLEFSKQETADISAQFVDETPAPDSPDSEIAELPGNTRNSDSSRRQAFQRAQDQLRTWCDELNSD